MGVLEALPFVEVSGTIIISNCPFRKETFSHDGKFKMTVAF